MKNTAKLTHIYKFHIRIMFYSKKRLTFILTNNIKTTQSQMV